MINNNNVEHKTSADGDEEDLESLFYLLALGFFCGVLCVFWLDIKTGWLGIAVSLFGFFLMGVCYYLDWIRRKHPDP